MLAELAQIDTKKLTPAERRQLLELLEQKDKLFRENRLAHYKPYAKQIEFHNLGADEGVRERLLIAGNQLGKTIAGSFECAMHLTGRYPDWWDGIRFRGATSGWAASLTSQGTRDTVQRLLLGRPGELGTGAIPAECIVEVKRSTHGVADSVETVTVRHEDGDLSRVTFKTYDQGRERWQGETLNFVWFDEEPPEDIYFEGLTRTNATAGIAWVTFTPLLGMSDVVKRFLVDKAPGTSVTTMTIYDAEHYTHAQRDAIIASYPAHEREARAMGTPTLGSGRIFPIEESDIREQAIEIPAHWPRIAGLDFGWDHPTASVWLAWDRDNDVVHLYDAYRVREATPVVHGAAIRARGDWIPVAWPHDGLQHDKGSGEALAAQYKKQGVNTLNQKATHPPKPGEREGTGDNGVEAGLMDMLDRMQTGRLRVAAHLNDWWEEFRLYHRKNGKIVKVGDDMMCLHPSTVVLTSKGPEEIVNLVGRTGFVLSVDGQLSPFHSCRMTRANAALVRVVFNDGAHLLCTPDHKLLTSGGEWVAAADSTGIECHNAVSHSKGTTWTKYGLKERGSSVSETTGAVLESFCTGRFGSTTTETSLQRTTSTTKTVTEKTTTSTTWSLKRAASTCQITTRATKEGLMRLWRRCQHGARALKANSGWLTWASATPTIYGQRPSLLASTAANSSPQRTQAPTGFVPTHARAHGDDQAELTWSPGSVNAVARSSPPQSTSLQPAAHDPVEESCGSQRPQASSTLRVLRVENAGRSDVYCMEVPELHAFAIGNGAVVHNCATRYALMMLRHAKVKPSKTLEYLPRYVGDDLTGPLG